MTLATIGVSGACEVGPRLAAAMDIRITDARTTLAIVCRDLGVSDRTMRAWRSGEHEIRFSDIERMQTYFDGLGCPGLIGDILRAASWTSDALKIALPDLPPVGRRLLESLADLRNAPDLEDALAERDLLGHVHIMMRSEGDKVSIIQRGRQIEAHGKIDLSTIGRDIRTLAPHGYGIEVYPQVMACLSQAGANHFHISSADCDYYRVGAAVGDFYVAHSYRINTSPQFVLR